MKLLIKARNDFDRVGSCVYDCLEALSEERGWASDDAYEDIALVLGDGYSKLVEDVEDIVQEALQGLGLSDDGSDQPDDTIAAEPSS